MSELWDRSASPGEVEGELYDDPEHHEGDRDADRHADRDDPYGWVDEFMAGHRAIARLMTGVGGPGCHDRCPRVGWSDRASVLRRMWHPAPWIGDEPVTALERLLDALERRLYAWDLTVVYAGILGVLCAWTARIVH